MPSISSGSPSAGQATADLALATASEALSRTSESGLVSGTNAAGWVVVGSEIVEMPNVDTYDAFPGCAQSADGTLVVVFRAGPMHTGGTDGRIYLTTSTDLGRSWTTPVLVRDQSLDLRDPCIAIAADDARWWITYFSYNTPGDPQLRSWVIYSDDRGQTWSSPVSLAAVGKAVCAPLVELADGSLIVPVYGDNGGKDAAWVVTSTDRGETWSAPVLAVSSGTVDYQEPNIVDLGNDTLLMTVRHNNQDGIATLTRVGGVWGAPTRRFDGWGAPRTTRMSTGRVVCIYRTTATGWGALVRSTDDGGVTWSLAQVFDSRTDQMVYAAPVEVAPGVVAVAYGAEDPITAGVSRIKMRYVLNGSGTSPIGDVAASVLVDAPGLALRATRVRVADDFQRNDGPPGTPMRGMPWEISTGNVVISGGSLHANATGIHFATVDTQVADYEVEADMRWVGTTGHGLVFRYSSTGNFLLFTSETDGANLRLYKVVAGVTTQLATAAAIQATTADGQTHTMKAVVRGNRVTTFLDGALIHAVSLTGDADLAVLSGKTKVGVRFNKNSGTVYHYCSRFVVFS